MDNKLKKIKCPVCKKETTWENNPYRPFCSRECKLADLYSWLSEEYRIKVISEDEKIKKENKEEKINGSF